jgi:hypothetical protein
MIRLCNDGVDGNGIDNDGIENDRVIVEGGDIGTDDIDIFEGLYLISFLPSRIIPSSSRCQAV